MRMDKLTTKFQEALGDAQSLALAKDHAYIDPAHVLLAMLQQQDGPKALLHRAGVNMTALMSAASAAVERLPQVTGQDQVQVGPELVKLLQAAEKESLKRGDAFVASDWKSTFGHMKRPLGSSSIRTWVVEYTIFHTY